MSALDTSGKCGVALASRPRPTGPWVITQTWRNLLFAHWPVPPDLLRPLVPGGLELDTFDGEAWVAVVPFRLTNIRMRPFPEVPFTDQFLELNVRTYVVGDGKPGVFFLSMEADNRWAIALARSLYYLPYLYSRISFNMKGDTVYFRHRRMEREAREAEFVAAYSPTSETFTTDPGTLEYWLTERYCCFGVNESNAICRADIYHLPWRLQKAQADIRVNTAALSHGIELPAKEPLLHYSRYVKAFIWPIKWLPTRSR
ncbi:MAG: YqjF family protein [Chloroflexia bacterium]